MYFNTEYKAVKRNWHTDDTVMLGGCHQHDLTTIGLVKPMITIVYHLSAKRTNKGIKVGISALVYF
jgi:hypothetical protein